MTDRSKKILMVAVFALLGLTMAFFLWYVFFRPEAGVLPTPTPPTPTSTGSLPTPGQASTSTAGVGTIPGITGPGQLPTAPFIPQLPPQQLAGEAQRTTVLSENINQYPTIAPGGDGVRVYDPIDGKFYKYDVNGNKISLSDRTFFDVQKVTWANKENKSVLEFPDGSKVMYDFDQNQQYTLPKHWEDFSFSPQDNQIAAKAIGNNSDNRFLVVANADGSNAKAVEELGDNQNKVQVSWSPNNQTIAFGHTADPIGFDREQIVMVGQNHENFKNLIVEGRGFVPNWAPDGQNLLYSVYNQNSGYRPTLWISGAAGDGINDNRRNLAINTWADKCSWKSGTELICAVPESLGQGAGLQRDLFASVPDNIVRVNLIDGSVVNLGRPEPNAVINQMVVSPDGTYVTYTDGLTGKLVKYRL